MPALGRLFTAADDRDRAPGTLLVSHRFWQAAYAGAEGVLGQHVTLDGQQYVIIGVMPRDFQFPTRAATNRALG